MARSALVVKKKPRLLPLPRFQAPLTSSGRHPEMLTMIGTLGGALLDAAMKSAEADRFRKRVREQASLARIVQAQSAVRGLLVLCTPPSKRRTCNYGYAFMWDTPGLIAPSLSLLARSNERNSAWRDLKDVRSYTVVPKPTEEQLGTLAPVGRWPDGRPKVDCVEVRMLNLLHRCAMAGSDSSILLYTERFPCRSCSAVIDRFMTQHKAINLTVAFGHGFDPGQNSAAHRRADLRIRLKMERDHAKRLKFIALRELPNLKGMMSTKGVGSGWR